LSNRTLSAPIASTFLEPKSNNCNGEIIDTCLQEIQLVLSWNCNESAANSSTND